MVEPVVYFGKQYKPQGGNGIHVGAEMPRYKCHKEVWALKIAKLEIHGEFQGATATPAEEGYAPFHLDTDYLRKHKPQVGGYFVVYDDGYQSFSPAKAFEDGYSRLQ